MKNHPEIMRSYKYREVLSVNLPTCMLASSVVKQLHSSNSEKIIFREDKGYDNNINNKLKSIQKIFSNGVEISIINCLL